VFDTLAALEEIFRPRPCVLAKCSSITYTLRADEEGNKCRQGACLSCGAEFRFGLKRGPGGQLFPQLKINRASVSPTMAGPSSTRHSRWITTNPTWMGLFDSRNRIRFAHPSRPHIGAAVCVTISHAIRRREGNVVLTPGFSGRILVAVESVDGRQGIRSLAGVVRSVLQGEAAPTQPVDRSPGRTRLTRRPLGRR
jgi:hypothetical protein